MVNCSASTQNSITCPACGGAGKLRLFFELSTCYRCNGSGREYYIPAPKKNDNKPKNN